MPPEPRVHDDDLLERLMEVFQLHGYEAATLAQLSAATGLQRASLYHRFPGGKQQMAEAVLNRASEWFGANVLEPLRGSGSPAARVRRMAERLDGFYRQGCRSCLLDTMSLGVGQGPFQGRVRAMAEAWLGAMQGVAVEAGSSVESARERAEDALLRIEGALVLARASGNLAPFGRILAGLPVLLTDAE